MTRSYHRDGAQTQSEIGREIIDTMLAEGTLAPDFDLPTHDGSRIQLSKLAGRYVILWIYPEADTPG